MGDRGLINRTPFAAQELFLTDENGRDLLAVVVKATYAAAPGRPLSLAEEQVPVDVAGSYYGDPETSSMHFEPEVAPLKPGTDVVLVGHAHPDRPGARQVDVGFQVGPLRKVIRVFGDRRWYSRMGFYRMSDPEPFERIPLMYERAFGGWDATSPDPEKHRVERRNPVGVGFRTGLLAGVVEDAPLPNLEDPRHLIRDFKDKPPPAGFGFIGPHWEPRVRYAGTYDEAWQKTRMPLLPKDFDRRFFNAAPPDQVTAGYLRGDEPVVVANASPGPWLECRLPGEPPPRLTIVQDGLEDAHPEAHLDTVILDTDAMQVLLLWRAHLPLPKGPHAVRAIRVEPHEQSVHARPSPAVVAVA